MYDRAQVASGQRIGAHRLVRLCKERISYTQGMCTRVWVHFVVEGGGGGGVSTIKITWADTRAAQRRRPDSVLSRFFFFFFVVHLFLHLFFRLRLLVSYIVPPSPP